MSAFPIEDMSNAYIEHSMVINNFVVEIGSQIKDSLCRVFGDGMPQVMQATFAMPPIPRHELRLLLDPRDPWA